MKTFCGKMPGTPCARGAGGGCGNPWWVSLEEQGHGVEKQPLSFLRSDSASVLGEEALHYLSGVYLRWGRRRQPQTCCCGAERSFIASEHHRDLPSVPRQKYWSGLSFPLPGGIPDPGMKPGSPALQADSLPSEPPGKPLQHHKAKGCDAM